MPKPNANHIAFRDDLLAILKKHAGHLYAIDMLAVSAHIVGQIIAMQDQRKVTKEIALDIVIKNIELGNSEVIDKLSGSFGKA